MCGDKILIDFGMNVLTPFQKYLSLLLLLTYLLTVIEFSLGVSSPFTSKEKKVRINIHKWNTKTQYKQHKTQKNTSTHITKTPTHCKTS
jgi:hypothetical protein